MIHPVNLPVFMSGNRPSGSEGDGNREPSTPRSSSVTATTAAGLFGPARDYVPTEFTYSADGRRLHRDTGVPTTPTTPGTYWGDVFKRSLITRLGAADEADRPEPQAAVHFPELQKFDFDKETEEAEANSTDTKVTPLEVRYVDLQATHNAAAHNTHEFSAVERPWNEKRLVVRRGQAFSIRIGFYRPFRGSYDDLSLTFQLGSRGWEGGGTRAVIDLETAHLAAKSAPPGPHGWAARVQDSEEDGLILVVEVTPPATCPVGNWELRLRTSTQNTTNYGRDNASEVPIEDIFILFNPWCQEDQVYLSNESERDEYVLNDVGKIWRGTHHSPQPCPWSFGQFEEGILEAVLFALDTSRLQHSLRGSPVHVSRAVAQVVNKQDEGGVLAGKWDDGFEDGTAPTAWTGSQLILHQFHRTGQSVRWGQCWNFAGVVTTVMRCLGIPCRPVSNFSSAHDTNGTCTVDYFYSMVDNRPLKDMSSDTIWNFHVWNDAWMRRPDLPEGYDGWQAIDATPQETSGGFYRLGPASLTAVKAGQTPLAYDAAFLFAEVNADKCYWATDPTGRERDRLLRIATNEVGRMILTKRPGRELGNGSDDRMDITHLYKHHEYTAAERESTMNAFLYGHGNILREYARLNSDVDDVQFNVDLNKTARIGQDFRCSLWVSNSSHEPRTVKVNVRVYTCDHRGKSSHRLRSDVQTISLSAGETTEVITILSVAEYADRLTEEACIRVSVTGHVLETAQLYAGDDEARLEAPELSLAAEGGGGVGDAVRLRVSFQNPLPSTTLTGCSLMVEGPGLVAPEKLLCPPVRARSHSVVQLEIVPWRVGVHTIVAHFTSDQLMDVNGSINIHVEP